MNKVDVLIAGTGAAGFATALTARKAGLSVLMVEKEPQFGGTTAYSAGVVWIPLNHQAKAEGLSDSRESALEYMAQQGGNYHDRARAEAFVDNAADMIRYFQDQGWAEFEVAPTWADYHPDEPGGSQGGRSLVPFPYDGRKLGKWFPKLRAPLKTMMGFGGMMIGRTDLPHIFAMSRSPASAWHVAKISTRYFADRAVGHHRGTRLVNGNALIARLADQALQAGVEIWLEAPLTGIEPRDGGMTATVTREGKEQQIEVTGGVVLASGGFPRSAKRTGSAYRHVAAGKNHVTLPPSGNQGDGAGLAETAGGRLSEEVGNPAAWVPASRVPQPDGSFVPYPHFFERGKPGYIAVDRRGKRFVSEACSYHSFVPAMMAACEGDDEICSWVICDHKAMRRFGLGAIGPAPTRLQPFLKSGYLKQGRTPEELAAACGIDAAGLAETIRRFNTDAANGADTEFHRGEDAYQAFNGDPLHGPNPSLGPLDRAPYYAVKMEPGELGTFAGIATDADARVLDADGSPIPRLYAVGNDALSVMGGAYPGAGITIGPAMTFGYIAARHISGQTG